MSLMRLLRMPRIRAGVLALWVHAAFGGVSVARTKAERAIAPATAIDEVAGPSRVEGAQLHRVVEPRASKSVAGLDVGLSSTVRTDLGAASVIVATDNEGARPLPPRRARFTYQATAPPRAL